MDEQLQNYLIKTFPTLYNHSEFKGFDCKKGWFRIILWASRYLVSYIELQNKYALQSPEKYLPIRKFKINEVSTKYGTVSFETSMGNDRIDAILSFIQYISGYICSETGKMDNIGYTKTGTYTTIHESLNNNDDFKYIDDEELRLLIKNNFN